MDIIILSRRKNHRSCYNTRMSKIDWFIIQSYTTLPDALKKPLQELDTLCFTWQRTVTPAQKKENDDKFCSGADIAGYVLAMEAGRLIGETKICKRTITFEHHVILLGGIGSVATHPDKRLRGVAKATVARAMEMLKDLGCDIAYLCVDERDPRKIALYRSFGFDLLYRPHTYLGKSGKRYTDTDAMIAPVNAPLLYNIVMDGTAPLDIGTGNW